MHKHNVVHGGHDIHYSDFGDSKSTPFVFLHGYLEAKEIWEPFIRSFPSTARCICIDLPGHGGSGSSGSQASMEDMAKAVSVVLNHLSVSRCVLVGHSMGGYAALAFADIYKDCVEGLVLFHSTPNPDTPEKKSSRAQEAELVAKGKKGTIVRQSIPKGFADDNQERLKDRIDSAIEIGLQTPDKGIIACLNGMANRRDRNDMLCNLKIPVLMIFGVKDNHIAITAAQQIAARFPQHESVFLGESGHMGFVEEAERSRKILLDFYGRAISG